MILLNALELTLANVLMMTSSTPKWTHVILLLSVLATLYTSNCCLKRGLSHNSCLGMCGGTKWDVWRYRMGYNQYSSECNKIIIR